MDVESGQVSCQLHNKPIQVNIFRPPPSSTDKMQPCFNMSQCSRANAAANCGQMDNLYRTGQIRTIDSKQTSGVVVRKFN
ncbi:hypothetical protein Zmor_026049 [Zophobas morio]|uniref:Uncharacterized protein n=1 Tax=Zophobas morio TaxID=2755281 RepID=A0AA38HSS9_9CUCU|nr:hypothetical protein Zmor_026049 [Zophobas morio]